jgi:TPR repeat protein
MEHDMEPVDEALMTNGDNLTTLLGAANQTDAQGMFELFVQYREAGDETEAHKWLKKSAEQGHCRALSVLGAFADPDDHLPLVLKAAEPGCDQAQYDLGLWYLHDLNADYVQKDYVQAAFWLTKAAEQGNMDAQLKLGKLYLEGQGVPQDDDVAVAWIRKSTEQDHEWAWYQLGCTQHD